MLLVSTGNPDPNGGLLAPGSTAWAPDLDAGFTSVPGLDAAPEDGVIVVEDGATPAIPRAEALSSTTPAPADATPIEVAAASLAFPGLSPRASDTDGATTPGAGAAPDIARHRYADLIGPEAMDREQRCLAEAVYFEARSEPEEGQAAVAQVVLNRVKSGLYPSNVCGVVYQNRHRYMGCQFSFALRGQIPAHHRRTLLAERHPDRQRRHRGADVSQRGRRRDPLSRRLREAGLVSPLKKMDVIGRHIFYQLKRGQT